MKKITRILIAVVIAVSLLVAVNLVANAETDGIYTYTVSDGKATITDCSTSANGDIVIPSTLGGYRVTSIGYSAFSYCRSLTSVVIPDGVTSIGDEAFYYCRSLTSVVIPDGVTSIGDETFSGCDSLTSVAIPDSVTSIGDDAFFGCDLLTNLIIPENVTSIGNGAFKYCHSLTSVVIPDGVTSIGAWAFDSSGIYYNSSNWENDALYICNHLIGVKSSFTGEFIVKDGTKTIVGGAFDDCTSLTSATIPDSVTSIGDGAFYGCTSLTRITIPDSVRELGNYAFKGCKSLVNVTMLNGVESIGSGAFQYCISLKNLIIPNSVISIGDWSFSNCNSLTITIGNSVKEIGDYAFFGCDSLTTITIPDCVTKIGDFAFWQCKSLTSITISDSVRLIGENAFSKCVSLKNVYYFGTVAQWNKINIGNNNEYILSASISYIREYDSLVNYRLRCTTAVVDGNLVLTANPAGTSSMKIRLGNLPEGAELMFAQSNSNVSMAGGIITVKNPGLGRVEVPMMIISAEGLVTDFVLVGDFGNAVRYATNARLSQSGNNLTVTSGNASAYLLFDTTDIDGGYIVISNESRNLLGRAVKVGTSAVRFYNPVYDEGSVTVTVKNANGEIVESYNVTMKFSSATEYTPILDSSLRCSYTVDGDTINVTADAGATNVYLILGKYYAESLSASVNDATFKKTGARTWRVMKSASPIEFDVYFDASAYGGEVIKKHFVINF